VALRHLAIAASFLLVAGAGCGSGGKTSTSAAHRPSPRRLIVQAARATSHATSYRVRLRLIYSGRHRVVLSGVGAADAATGLGKLTIDMSAVKRLNPRSLGGAVEVVYSSKAVYLHWPRLLEAQPSLRPWLRESVAQAQSRSGEPSGTVVSAGINAPRLLVLTAVAAYRADAVRSLGDATVQGRPASHYLLLVPPRKLGLRAPRKLRDEVWIDRHGRLVGTLLDFGPLATPSNGTATFEIEEEFYEFGRPVQVKLPPPSQVGELSSIRRSQ
jgi:hypothetical protein